MALNGAPSVADLLRARHAMRVVRLGPGRLLRSSYPAELAGCACPYLGPGPGALHPGRPDAQIRCRCHLIVSFSLERVYEKYVELRGFEPLTSYMPYKYLPPRDMAGYGSTRRFNRCTL